MNGAFQPAGRFWRLSPAASEPHPRGLTLRPQKPGQRDTYAPTTACGSISRRRDRASTFFSSTAAL